MYGGPFVGAQTIAERWVAAVENFGSMWTVDQLLTDPASGRAVMEWTHFKTFQGTVLRGDEWYDFDPRQRPDHARSAPYYASPQDKELERLELGGFDYEARGYATSQPFVRPVVSADRASHPGLGASARAAVPRSPGAEPARVLVRSHRRQRRLGDDRPR